jgi:murein DD-endopeptidase MepM/ murein hydrolase activator NlpD
MAFMQDAYARRDATPAARAAASIDTRGPQQRALDDVMVQRRAEDDAAIAAGRPEDTWMARRMRGDPSALISQAEIDAPVSDSGFLPLNMVGLRQDQYQRPEGGGDLLTRGTTNQPHHGHDLATRSGTPLQALQRGRPVQISRMRTEGDPSTHGGLGSEQGYGNIVTTRSRKPLRQGEDFGPPVDTGEVDAQGNPIMRSGFIDRLVNPERSTEQTLYGHVEAQDPTDPHGLRLGRFSAGGVSGEINPRTGLPFAEGDYVLPGETYVRAGGVTDQIGSGTSRTSHRGTAPQDVEVGTDDQGNPIMASYGAGELTGQSGHQHIEYAESDEPKRFTRIPSSKRRRDIETVTGTPHGTRSGAGVTDIEGEIPLADAQPKRDDYRHRGSMHESKLREAINKAVRKTLSEQQGPTARQRIQNAYRGADARLGGYLPGAQSPRQVQAARQYQPMPAIDPSQLPTNYYDPAVMDRVMADRDRYMGLLDQIVDPNSPSPTDEDMAFMQAHDQEWSRTPQGQGEAAARSVGDAFRARQPRENPFVPDYMVQGPEGQLVNPIEGGTRTSLPKRGRTITLPDGSTKTSHHYGVDFGAPAGTEIRGPYRDQYGRVVRTGRDAGTGRGAGNFTVLQYQEPFSADRPFSVDDLDRSVEFKSFHHQDESDLQAGDYVSPDDVIGHVGSTGGSTGPHGHFELRRSGTGISDAIETGTALGSAPSRVGSTGTGRGPESVGGQPLEYSENQPKRDDYRRRSPMHESKRRKNKPLLSEAEMRRLKLLSKI